MELTKQQRNDVFKAIARSGINSAEFDLDTNPTFDTDIPGIPDYLSEPFSRESLLVTHPPSASKLVFHCIKVPAQRRPEYYVWKEIGTDPPSGFGIDGWHDFLNEARYWALRVHGYVETPDLWAEIKSQREFFTEAGLANSGNTPFSPAERAEIAAQLREIRDYLKRNLSLSSEQTAQVEARINEAEAASHRLDRKDWLLLFLGTTVTLVVTDLIPATAVQHITAMVLHGLGHMFGVGMAPPSLAG